MLNENDELTPVMSEADLQSAEGLSQDRLRPPVAIQGFEQKEFLGRGSFGEVWKAVDTNNGRVVAIKYFKHGGSVDWSHMAREVEKLRYLFSDRYVVQLFEIGWESDPPYYVMEYMECGSLEDRLRSESLSVTESLSIIRDVAQGLVHAHDRGILHCDLKPANIMLDQDGSPRLADFGQARLRQDHSPSLGTLFYMAPEQADLKAMPDARWDVYALGVILYRMITGELPYRLQPAQSSTWATGTIDERLKAYRDFILSAPVPQAHHRIPGVDKSLADIVDRCLRVNPKHRYHNVQALLTDLRLRETRLANRSLLILGGLGPIIVALTLTLIGALMFRNSVRMASFELLNRTRESNSFAAESVATRLALEVDKRWRILEQEAESAQLRAWLADPAAGGSSDSPSQAQLHQWITAKQALWNQQFGEVGKAAYWFILDRQGMLRTLSPLGPSEQGIIGQYFGYRDYFHGQGKELSKTDPAPEPIAHPYRSAVFRSQPANIQAVAFSVPIFQDADEKKQIVGVLVMETILKDISEFRGRRNQAAVLVDLRPDLAGRPGLIVDHPSLSQPSSDEQSVQSFYLDDTILSQVIKISNDTIPDSPHSKSPMQSPQTTSDSGQLLSEAIIDSYDDPLTDVHEDDYYAAVAPVVVLRGNQPQLDTGWSVLIQERQVDTLAPISRVWAIFAKGGAIGLAVVLGLLGLLWVFVAFVVNRSGKAVQRKLDHATEKSSTNPSMASGSASSASAYGSST